MSSKSRSNKGSVSDSRKKPQVESQSLVKFDVCHVCNKKVSDDSESIECDHCKVWIHFRCSDLSEREFEVLKKSSDNIQYYCSSCSGERSTLRLVMDRLEKISAQLMDINTRLITAERGDNPLLEEKIKKIVENEVKAYLEEKEEQDNRKDNLVIFNLPESKKEKEDDRRDEDRASILEVLKKTGLSKTEASSTEVIARLGRYNKTSKTVRPIKIRIVSDDIRRRVLSNSRKVNEVSTDVKSRIYINRDRTVQQREADKLLRADLVKKNKEGGNWIINWKKHTLEQKKDEKKEDEELQNN